MTMLASQWIKQAQQVGWRIVSSRDGSLHMRCGCQGCAGALKLPIADLGPAPEPCDRPHVGQYGQQVYDAYMALVDVLRRRRRALGLSQEDIAAAAGLADGHINKLEAFARTAQFSTLQLWAETLGLSLTMRPAPLPPSIVRAIKERARRLHDETKVPCKPHMAEPNSDGQ